MTNIPEIYGRNKIYWTNKNKTFQLQDNIQPFKNEDPLVSDLKLWDFAKLWMGTKEADDLQGW